jgi:formamidopyrimidine-DNA glycosylase
VPELPEVETTLRGLLPHLMGIQISGVVLHRPDLRWPIPTAIHQLAGQKVISMERRAKYILMHTKVGTAIWHLGMSGNLRVVPSSTALRTHDHVDVLLAGAKTLRFHDPRRFGCLMFHAGGAGNVMTHPLLKALGPEPLSTSFSAAYLFACTRARKQAIKTLLMDQKHVVGVGNIYAAEALFAAHVRPTRRAARVTNDECATLVDAIKRILSAAIERGGTTLRDFVNAEGEPGYFEQELMVYGREGEPCRVCKTAIRAADLGQRQSLYCPKCQR